MSRRLYKIAQSFLTVCLHLLPQQIELSQRVLGKLIALGSRVLQKLNGRIYILWHTLRAGEQQLPLLRVGVLQVQRQRLRLSGMDENGAIVPTASTGACCPSRWRTARPSTPYRCVSLARGT